MLKFAIIFWGFLFLAAGYCVLKLSNEWGIIMFAIVWIVCLTYLFPVILKYKTESDRQEEIHNRQVKPYQPEIASLCNELHEIKDAISRLKAQSDTQSTKRKRGWMALIGRLYQP